MFDKDDYWFNRLSTDKDGKPTPQRGQSVAHPQPKIIVQGKGATVVLGVKKIKRENPSLPKRALLDLKAEAWEEYMRRKEAAIEKITPQKKVKK